MKSKFTALRTKYLCIISLSFSASLPAHAADGTWTGSGTTQSWTPSGWVGAADWRNWMDADNWTSAIPAGGIDDIANFSKPSGSFHYVNLDSSTTLGGLNFSQAHWLLQTNTNPFSSLTLATNSGMPMVTVGSSSVARLDVPLQGAQGFVKNGLGELWLSANNTYSGQTLIESGIVYATGANALGIGGVGNGTLVSEGAQIHFDSNIVGESLTIAGNGTEGFGAITGYSGAWGGSVTLTADAKIGAVISGDVTLNGNNLTLGDSAISGGISGVGNLIVDGDAHLSGNNSFTGTTTVRQGGDLTLAGPSAFHGGDGSLWTKEKMTVESDGVLALRVGGTGDFTTTQAVTVLNELSTNINNNGLMQGATFGIDTTNASGNVTFSHVIADSTGVGGGSLGFAKFGNGTLMLDQANTYSGDTLIDRGVLLVSGNGKLGNGSGSLTLGWLGDPALDLGGTTQNFVNVTSWGGSIANGTLNASGTYQLDNSIVTANLTGSAGLDILNATILSGNNSFTGKTSVINQGSLWLESTSALYGGDLSQWNSSRISVGDGSIFEVRNVTTAQASSIYNQLRNSNYGQGLNAGACIAFMLNSGNQTWTNGILDSNGNTSGRNMLFVDYANPSENYESVLTLAGSGTFSGSATFNSNLRFAADNATGTGELYAFTVNLNGYDATTRGGYAEWLNEGASTSNLVFHVDSSDPAYDPNWGSNFGGSIDREYSGGQYGGINLKKTGSGTAVYNGILGTGLKSIDVSAGTLILSENASSETNNYNYGISSNYIGATVTIRNGASMLVHGNLGSRVVVESGALLGGHGTLDERVTVQTGGTLAPGASIGSLSSGSVTFANNSTYDYEVDSSVVASAGADLLVINGDLNLNLTKLAFNNIAEAPQSFEVGTMFSLMNYTGTWNGGLFVLGANVLENGEEFYAGQNYWRIDYDVEQGGLNFDFDQVVSESSRFINITATAVPEPSAMLLGAAASLMLLRRRR